MRPFTAWAFNDLIGSVVAKLSGGNCTCPYLASPTRLLDETDYPAKSICHLSARARLHVMSCVPVWILRRYRTWPSSKSSSRYLAVERTSKRGFGRKTLCDSSRESRERRFAEMCQKCLWRELTELMACPLTSVGAWPSPPVVCMHTMRRPSCSRFRAEHKTSSGKYLPSRA